MGFGVSKAGCDAQALAQALRDHDDIDTALGAYDRLRQPIGETIVKHSRKLGTHMGVNLQTEEDRAMHALLQDPRAMMDWIAVAELPGRLSMSPTCRSRLTHTTCGSSAIATRVAGSTIGNVLF